MWHAWEQERWGDLRERGHLKNIGLDGRIILKWIFMKWDGETWIGLVGLIQGQIVDCCEHGDEPSCFS
jgi:hypothetical protein